MSAEDENASSPGEDSNTGGETEHPKARAILHRIAVALLVLALSVGAFTLYLQVGDHDFLYFDDELLVTENEMIQRGLTLESVGWAFTSGQGANWLPITRLSHMLDVKLFGQSPSGPHLVNAIIHACAVALLFTFLLLTTRRLWPSTVVAALFAVHPLHVESVAWVSGRKDVLSALFWFAALLAYRRYVKGPTVIRYAIVALFFALAFMSKPVAVALPLTLLIADYWPFARHTAATESGSLRRMTWLVVEKLPLFALSAVFSWITIVTQRQAGAMQAMNTLSLPTRIGNALVAYPTYIRNTVWPRGLHFPYPHPGDTLPLWQPIAAAAFLVALTIGASTSFRRRPYLIAGWLWFIITLVPVIGLIQVGYQSMADRYMYIPITGLFIAVSWWAADLTTEKPLARTIASAAAIVAIVLFSTVCWNQQPYWRDTETLMQRAIDVDDHNAPAYTTIGVVYLRQQRPVEAEINLRIAVSLDPRSVQAHSNLGSALRMQDRLPEAQQAFFDAIALDPATFTPNLNLGTLLLTRGLPEEAARYLETAAALEPEDLWPRYSLVEAYLKLGDRPRAIEQLEIILRLDPEDAKAAASLNQLRETVQASGDP